jgi:hypothetical protein
MGMQNLAVSREIHTELVDDFHRRWRHVSLGKVNKGGQIDRLPRSESILDAQFGVHPCRSWMFQRTLQCDKAGLGDYNDRMVLFRYNVAWNGYIHYKLSEPA